MTEQLRFLTPTQVRDIAAAWGTPTFVYSEAVLRQHAQHMLSFEAPYGLTVRYAMKANPQAAILKIFKDMGIKIDASSGPEAERAIRAGFAPSDILVTSQQLPTNIAELAAQGVQFNASSLHQLELLGKALPGAQIGVRINPGVGSGHSNRVNVGGPTSSFGIWHEYTDRIHDIATRYNLRIVRLHTHVGSGADSAGSKDAIQRTLKLVEQFPSVTILNTGSGFKVGRVQGEKTTDVQQVSHVIATALQDFAERTGRKLALEIEPGSYLTVTAGALIARVQDIVDTGADGYRFLKIDAGLSDFIRPSMYGAQHAIVVVNDAADTQDYVVVGRACESGDILTPQPQHPEQIAPRTLATAAIGDPVVIEGVGAYVYSFNVAGYNSFGQAMQLLLTESGELQQIYRAQTLDDLLANEVL